MSIHSSLALSSKGKKHRSVLKRFERIKTLSDKDKWKDGDSVFGLPKLKIVRIKIKKEKAAATATEAGTTAAAAPGAAAPAASTAAAKPAAKTAAAKPASGKK